MKSRVDQLRFLIEFAATDLDSPSREECRPLVERIHRFSEAHDFSTHTPTRPTMPVLLWERSTRAPRRPVKGSVLRLMPFPVDDATPSHYLRELEQSDAGVLRRVVVDFLRPLQDELRRLLNELVDGRDWSVRGDVGTRITVTLAPVVGKRHARLAAHGTYRDLFLLVILLLLTSSLTRPILRCPECRTIFYRVRRQQYCQSKCTDRANMRAWRKSQKGRRRESKRRRARYGRQVRTRVGLGARVRRHGAA